MQWLRLYSEARTDNKLRTLTDAQHRVWFNLLCYASEQPRRGEIQERESYMLAIECAGGDEGLLIETLGVLGRLRIIEHAEDGSFHFRAWDERQYDKPSDRPEATAERKRKSRASHAPSSNKEDASRDVTPSHAVEQIQIQNRTDTEAEQSRVEGAGADAPRTTKKRPTQIPEDWIPDDGLLLWCDGKGISENEIVAEAERFVNHYRSKGEARADWSASFRNWMTSPIRAQQRVRGSPNGATATKRAGPADFARLAGMEAGDDH